MSYITENNRCERVTDKKMFWLVLSVLIFGGSLSLGIATSHSLYLVMLVQILCMHSDIPEKNSDHLRDFPPQVIRTKQSSGTVLRDYGILSNYSVQCLLPLKSMCNQRPEASPYGSMDRLPALILERWPSTYHRKRDQCTKPENVKSPLCDASQISQLVYEAVTYAIGGELSRSVHGDLVNQYTNEYIEAVMPGSPSGEYEAKNSTGSGPVLYDCCAGYRPRVLPLTHRGGETHHSWLLSPSQSCRQHVCPLRFGVIDKDDVTGEIHSLFVRDSFTSVGLDGTGSGKFSANLPDRTREFALITGGN